MIFVDTHAHIFFKDFDSDRAEVLSRARTAGVAAVIDVGLDADSNLKAILDAEKFPGVFPTAGWHPHDAKDFDASRFSDFIDEHESAVIAFGEFGLDFFHNFSPRDAQLKVFEKTLQICAPKNKPIIIHCRDAQEETIAVLRAAGPLRGVMHCFSGGPDLLEQTLELGFHISVGGPVTYPKNDILRQVVKTVPLKRLLLETDCPYLSPQKFRGKRNEPSYIPIAAAEISRVRDLPVEKIAAATTSNACDLFGAPLKNFLESYQSEAKEV